jgi:hypothetical protein
MQTTRTLDARMNMNDGSRRRAIGANLIVVGALSALAAIALLILVADPGGPVSTSPSAPSAVVDAPAQPAASPTDQDRSWLCNVISDDSAPESRVAVREILAREGITCADGPVVDGQATQDG